MKLRVAGVPPVPPLLALLALAIVGCKPDPAPAPPTSTASAPRDAAGPPVVARAMGSSSSAKVQRTPTFAVEVIVPDGPAAPLGVRYQTDQLTVVGLVDPDDLELHPARAELTGGFLITTRVRITQITGEQAEIEPVLGPGIERLDARPAVTVACRELSLDEPDQARALAPPAPEGTPRLVLRPGAPVDLAVEPGGRTAGGPPAPG